MKIAQTVQSVANGTHPLIVAITDRNFHIDMAFVRQVMSLTQFTWHGRRPTASIDKDGKERKTNLDLLSVLVELARRRARIELPGYDNRLAWEIVAGEQHVGTTRRYGPIVRLISHREHLSFSVRIHDESIIRTGDKAGRGAERSYMMVNHQGEWHQGWRGLTWELNPDEEEFFKGRHILPSQGQLRFKYYVHPNRRQSLFSRPYLDLKALCLRLEQETRFYAGEMSRLREDGVDVPKDCEPAERPVLARGETRNEFVPSFMVNLRGLRFRGRYPKMTTDATGYRQAYWRHQELSEELRPTAQFMVRADEVAYYFHGLDSDFTPWWIEGPKWTHGPKRKSGKIRLFGNLELSYSRDMVPMKVAAD